MKSCQEQLPNPIFLSATQIDATQGTGPRKLTQKGFSFGQVQIPNLVAREQEQPQKQYHNV